MPVNDLTINTLRFLSVDAIQKANSGHPGMAMGAAPMACALYGTAMKHNPKNPHWPNRDRFVLSAGHGSALLYSLLHVFGYDVSLEDLQQFRQWGSKTPGHPEYRHTPGVEITTGPLGQGIANAVGFAWAENYLAAKFNKPGIKLVDHYTFALCGDGCMMEGITYEATSLAGTLGLGKLIVLYDSNDTTIEGPTDLTFQENVGMRFESCGWHVQKITEGNDTAAILQAIEAAKKVTDKPSFIEVKTIIGYGSPNKGGKAASHGAPLGEEEVKLTKSALGWPDEDFFVPDEVKAEVAKWQANKAQMDEDAWNALVNLYKTQYPEAWKEWEQWHSDELPVDVDNMDDFWHNEGVAATRVSSGQVLNKVSKFVPNLIGGSADLASSTQSIMDGREWYSKGQPGGSNLYFGIREHAMTAIANAMAAHGGLRPYVSGFFIFCDYMKPAMRMSALMGLPVIYILTHDSIGVGEDGPTHQPVEQLLALRGIPNFTVIRPCDANETAAAWALALKRRNSPTALILSRQNVPACDGAGRGAYNGAYILRDSDSPDILIMASGSEVGLVCKAYDRLKEKGINARVVSFPSFEIFEEHDEAYKESIMPKGLRKRLAVEAGVSLGWHKYVGLDGCILSVDGFGASAPPDRLFAEYGFTVENIVEQAVKLCSKNK